MFRISLYIVLFSILFACNDIPVNQNPKQDILDKLSLIEGITVEEIPTIDHFDRYFMIRFEQPIDHDNPTTGKFSQKIYLGHVDTLSPVILETEGYSRDAPKTRELASSYDINQISIEHRYFGSSIPAPPGYQFLDIWQSANDHHRIVQVFKLIYPGNWVSSGVSKGGDASIFHRRFFPGDVDGTVAYVAPILHQEQDERFLEYYNTTGSEECRNKLKSYQQVMLQKIDSFPSLFDNYVNFVNQMYGTDIKFSLPYKNIIYHSIREDYFFEFWSSENEDCSTIPEVNASIHELFDHYVGVFDVFLFFSDYGVDLWTPYTYQAKTELGNYAFDVSHLEDFNLPIDPLVTFQDIPDFNPAAMNDIVEWIMTECENMIFIYGEKDPWTVAAVNHPGSETVLKMVNPGSKHKTRISDMDIKNQNLVYDKVREWLNL